MKKIYALILALVLGFGCFSLCTGAADNSIAETAPYAYGYVKPAALNVRQGPGTDYERIGGLSQNDQIFIIGQENTAAGNWYKINYHGEAGYVLANQIFYCDEYCILSFCTYSEDEMPCLLDPSSLPAHSPTRTGYTFRGWTSQKGSDTVEYMPLDSITLSSNMMLYAVWQAPTFPTVSVLKASYNANVSVYITVDNVPYGCRLLINGELSEPQEAGCGHLGMSVSLGQLQEDAVIHIAVTDNEGNPIDDLAHTVTVEVNNGFFGKIAAFFRYIFNGFQRPYEHYVF